MANVMDWRLLLLPSPPWRRGAVAPFARVAGDEVYGDNGPLRAWLEQQGIRYVLAVSCDHRVPAGAGHLRAGALAARLPRRSWQRLSAGEGAKGRRYHDWAWITIPGPVRDTAGC